MDEELLKKIILSEPELGVLIDKIVNYKRKRNKFILSLEKAEVNELATSKRGKMCLRTSTICEFMKPADIELDFLRELIKEFNTGEEAFEKFKELINVLWVILPPYTLSAGGEYYGFEYEEEEKKEENSSTSRHLWTKISLGFDHFVEKLREDEF